LFEFSYISTRQTGEFGFLALALVVELGELSIELNESDRFGFTSRKAWAGTVALANVRFPISFRIEVPGAIVRVLVDDVGEFICDRLVTVDPLATE
jgi:hypothetical protein